jgi:hypothetical protein
MNCQNCKNPIQQNSHKCEWCGSEINNSNVINPTFQKETSENQILNKISIDKSRNKTIYLIPGSLILITWLVGNMISERDKHAIFGMDDLSPILFIGLIFLVIGVIIRFIKN